jgi:L-amino acid N-acyltransferase YncA
MEPRKAARAAGPPWQHTVAVKRLDSPPIALRAAGEADIAAIAAIYAHHVRTGTATFEIEAPDATEMLRRWREVVSSGLPYVVAVASSEVIGYAYAAPYRPRPAYRFTVEDSIYVRDDSHGRGIGRALLAELIDGSTRAGARQMIAVIGDAANAASIRLHAALGFRSVGVLASVGYKFARWLDVIVMQRPLGPGDSAPGEQ